MILQVSSNHDSTMYLVKRGYLARLACWLRRLRAVRLLIIVWALLRLLSELDPRSKTSGLEGKNGLDWETRRHGDMDSLMTLCLFIAKKMCQQRLSNDIHTVYRGADAGQLHSRWKGTKTN